ncbi:hypothetical protein TorRG33x02_337370 [Trema orientale]|uniref:Uncharacterized protein n=1 Tax=Trema orientale TaxID=63057 RepID=A0A2P5AZ63_TREOI|nr:hypothetical protein TorRG33x02_337370 [Trema orientale]
MSDLLARRCRIFNDCPESIRLQVIRDPGNFLDKKYTIPRGEYVDIYYRTVDTSYNQGRSKEIRIVREGQEKYEGDYISSYDIGVCEKIKLTLIDNDKEENTKKVHVCRVKGNYFLRIGIAWKLKDIVQKMKKPEKKPEGEKQMETVLENGTMVVKVAVLTEISTPMDVNVTLPENSTPMDVKVTINGEV